MCNSSEKGRKSGDFSTICLGFKNFFLKKGLPSHSEKRGQSFLCEKLLNLTNLTQIR